MQRFYFVISKQRGMLRPCLLWWSCHWHSRRWMHLGLLHSGLGNILMLLPFSLFLLRLAMLGCWERSSLYYWLLGHSGESVHIFVEVGDFFSWMLVCRLLLHTVLFCHRLNHRMVMLRTSVWQNCVWIQWALPLRISALTVGRCIYCVFCGRSIPVSFRGSNHQPSSFWLDIFL